MKFEYNLCKLYFSRNDLIKVLSWILFEQKTFLMPDINNSLSLLLLFELLFGRFLGNFFGVKKLEKVLSINPVSISILIRIRYICPIFFVLRIELR